LIAEENPGVRLRAVSALQQQTPPDQEAITALIGALRTDPNPAVRQKAVEALRKYPSTPAIRAAYVDALVNDHNARIRIEAIDGLSSAADSGVKLDHSVLEQLSRQLSRDENSYVRQKGIEFLEQAGYSLN
jgi:HEAT repeat protein